MSIIFCPTLAFHEYYREKDHKRSDVPPTQNQKQIKRQSAVDTSALRSESSSSRSSVKSVAQKFTHFVKTKSKRRSRIVPPTLRLWPTTSTTSSIDPDETESLLDKVTVKKSEAEALHSANKERNHHAVSLSLPGLILPPPPPCEPESHFSANPYLYLSFF